MAYLHSITPRLRRQPTPRAKLRRIILIGSRIPDMTHIGSSGPSRSTIRIFRFRPFTSAGGLKFFLLAHSGITWELKGAAGQTREANGSARLCKTGGAAASGAAHAG